MSISRFAHAKTIRVQQVIWDTIRDLKRFTEPQLIIQAANRCGQTVSDRNVQAYMNKLKKGGYVVKDGMETRSSTFYTTSLRCSNIWRLARNTGHEAPRLTADGQPSKLGRGQENMWRSMRTLGTFNYRELAAVSSTNDVAVSEQSAKLYSRALLRAGYLVIAQPPVNKKSLRVYRFVQHRFTGPLPPVLQTIDQIYDPNTNQVVWSSDQEAV